MVRIRHGWLVAVVAVGFTAGACKKDEKKTETPGSGAATTPDTTPDTATGKVAEKPAGQTPTPSGPAAARHIAGRRTRASRVLRVVTGTARDATSKRHMRTKAGTQAEPAAYE